jgi:hypothetical protein
MAIFAGEALDLLVTGTRERLHFGPLKWQGHYLAVYTMDTLENLGMTIEQQAEWLLGMDKAMLSALYKPKYIVSMICDCHPTFMRAVQVLHSEHRLEAVMREFCIEHVQALVPMVLRS